MNTEGRRDLLELLKDRYEARSTLVTSQLPVVNSPCTYGKIRNGEIRNWKCCGVWRKIPAASATGLGEVIPSAQ